MHTRPLACLPNAQGAMLGELGHFSAKMGKEESWDSIAAEAARTVPGRENGGNCDIKNLSTGCNARRAPLEPQASGRRPQGLRARACDPGPASLDVRAPPPRLRQVYFPVFVPGANLSMGDVSGRTSSHRTSNLRTTHCCPRRSAHRPLTQPPDQSPDPAP